MSKQSIKATIDANIKQNGVQAITGQIMNSVLNQMVDNLAEETGTNNRLSNLEEKFESEYDAPTLSIFKDGYYVGTSGRRGDYSVFAIFSPFQVKKGDRVEVAGAVGVNSAVAVIAWQDNPRADSDMACVPLIIGEDGRTEYEAVSPNDGYIFISCSRAASPSVRIYKIIDLEQIEENTRDIDLIHQKTVSLDSRVTTLEDAIVVTSETPISLVSNYYINASTRQRDYYSPFETYGGIPVKQGQKISVIIDDINSAVSAISFSTLAEVGTQTFDILATYHADNNHYEAVIQNDGYVFIGVNNNNPPAKIDVSENVIGQIAGNVKKWAGKKWVVIGDSLTEKNQRATKFYHEYIADKTGIEVVNMGVGGTGYIRQYDTGNSFVQRALTIPTDADVVTIFGSFNDKGIVAPLGDISDGNYDTTTIVGCINSCIRNIYAVNPLVKLGIVTPCPWKDMTPLSGNPDNPYYQYCNAIIEICRRRGIPCLDLFTRSGLRPWEAEYRALVYDKDQGGDGNPAGCHPNEIGHEILASHFESLLDELLLH